MTLLEKHTQDPPLIQIMEDKKISKFWGTHII